MKCLAQAVAEKSRGQDARPRTDGLTDGRTVVNTISPASSPTAMAGDNKWIEIYVAFYEHIYYTILSPQRGHEG